MLPGLKMLTNTLGGKRSGMVPNSGTPSSIETVDTFNDNPVDCGETVVSIVNHERRRRNSGDGDSSSGFLNGVRSEHTLLRPHNNNNKEQGPMNRPELPLPAPKNKTVRSTIISKHIALKNVSLSSHGDNLKNM